MLIYGACFWLLLSFAVSEISAQDSERQQASTAPAKDMPTQAPQPTPPPYLLDRQDEDWSMMRDPAHRSDWSDKLRSANWNVDGFVVKPVENDRGFFDATGKFGTRP